MMTFSAYDEVDENSKRLGYEEYEQMIYSCLCIDYVKEQKT